jgi:hypothetical protein
MNRETESLPQLYQHVNTLWHSRQASLGDAAAEVKQIMTAVQHILQGFEILVQGRKSPAAVAQFRVEMKQASASLIETEPIVSVLTEAASPDSRISTNVIQDLNTWTRQTLNQVLGALQPVSQLGIRPREVIEILDEEQEQPKKRRRRMIIEDDEEEEEEEEEEEVLPDDETTVEGITLNLAPFYWPDRSNNNVWKYSLFKGDEGAYDMHGSFATRELAEQTVDQFINQVRLAGDQGYLLLLQQAYTAWTLKNENQACRDVRGAEMLTIQDDPAEVEDHYIVAFHSMGPKQLNKLKAYQILVDGDEKDPGYQTAWEATFAEIKQQQSDWTKRILKVAQDILPTVKLVDTRITKCKEIDGEAPILAMISMVLHLPLGTSEAVFQNMYKNIFNAV